MLLLPAGADLHHGQVGPWAPFNFEVNDSPANRALAARLGLELNYTVNEQIGCTWRSPDEEYYMLNTDGSVQQSGNGYGGTIRDSQGNVLMGFARSSSKPSVIFQELFAIAMGLKQAQSLSIAKLEINSDSLGVINIINGLARSPCHHLLCMDPLPANLEESPASASDYLHHASKGKIEFHNNGSFVMPVNSARV
ncbi:hypothetical protein IFM89_008856 [Coptis chinensis]|uniref:RNase H type-1 domain-containing protein n=1 Tax=Coptis chinensis TaxID=261450 RepID=A0A835H9R2_9MAGN|nr:hypothetical protein IFM89_008856 [Coptis chinensis]